MEDNLLKVEQVAARLSCSDKAVYAMAARLEIASIRVGRRGVRFRSEDVEAYLASRRREMQQQD